MSDSLSGDALADKVKNLPELPGVYRFIGKGGVILYIGKAKNLRKRVASYFLEGRNQSYRIRLMVRKAEDLAFTLTRTESEALLLENNLIKENQPRYNINLKDGKTYPFICIKNESFPRIFSTRKKIRDGSQYFGPFANVKAMQTLLDLIRQNFQLRTCNLVLSDENIRAGKFKACLEYQIGNCGAPCEGKTNEEDYQRSINEIRKILNGNLGSMLEQLNLEMMAAADALEFEQAEKLRKRLEKLQDYKQRSTVFSEKLGNLDVITLLGNETLAVVNHFRIRNGTITQTHGFEIGRKEAGDDEEILTAAISKLVSEDDSLAKEWISNRELSSDELPEGISCSVPQRGEKQKLIEMSLRNCKTLMEEKIFSKAQGRRTPNSEALAELQRYLHLRQPPLHIECFDNSNFQGSSPVASLVVFKNGAPAKKDYRHFHIRTVEGPNDFASMEEIVSRRYKRLLEEEQPLPDLIMVDGGKGQLSSAAKSLQNLGLLGKIPLIGIAKQLEEIFIVNDPVPLHIDKRSPALKLLQQLRNEAHRFAITFHRDTRSKAQTSTTLEKLEGVGPVTAKKILRHFKSVKKFKEAGEEARREFLGEKLSEKIEAAIRDGLL